MNAKRTLIVEIEFTRKTRKTRLSRIIRELNDLCISIYKLSDKAIDDWIILNPADFMFNVSHKIVVDYVPFFCTIKILRTKMLKLQDLTENTKKNLRNTEHILDIINYANEKGFLMGSQTIKRKYQNRKSNQEKKIERNCQNFNFACTIKFFYLWLIKILFTDEKNSVNFKKDFADELDAEILDEYVTYLAESF